MNWTELLKGEVEANYGATVGLVNMVGDDELAFKPATGENWMTTGQLLMHITTACGFCCKGFVTGDWGMPEGMSIEDMPPEEMLPPAEKMPTVETIAQAIDLLAADKRLALEMIDQPGEESLASREVTAPWNPTPKILGAMLLDMVGHLASHKGQLFYYLKLMGKPVDTGHLWGM
ncbi:MAG: DinB family protein [Planctomycetota bacterium]|jgi:hypothetical protein